MCICCCNTRKSILIYMMVISLIATIYGIIVLTQFASNSKTYDKFLNKVKGLKPGQESDTEDIGDDASIEQIIDALEYSMVEDKNYNFVESLKGIENGLGIVLFIFPIIFLIVEIVFFIFVWGDKEYKPLPTTLYKIFNIIKIVCIVLSIIFILLSILYIVFLALAFVQFFLIAPSFSIHEFFARIIIGIVFGIYLIWFYINLSCAFCKERNLFKNVGSIDNPGPNANGANGNQFSGGAKPEGDQVYSDARVMN